MENHPALFDFGSTPTSTSKFAVNRNQQSGTQQGPALPEQELVALATLASAPLTLVHPEWATALAPLEHALIELGSQLEADYISGGDFLPAPSKVLRALEYAPSHSKVLIVGQDPYPTPGNAVGLSFSVDRATRPLPRSLNNIFSELRDDLGIEPSPHGDLSAWAEQGVLLLNRVFTVTPGAAGSHRRRGWEEISDAIIETLVALDQPLVAILWGKDAQNLKPQLGDSDIIESAHPSPLSARRGFFGSKPFSRANELLLAQGALPIDWSLPADC